MSPQPTLTVILEGLEATGGDVALGDLWREFQLLANSLRKAEQLATGEPNPYHQYRVVGLTHESPYTLTVLPVSVPGRVDRGAEIVNFYMKTLAGVRARRTQPEPVDEAFFGDLLGMASAVGKTIKAVNISSNGTSVSLDRGFQNNVRHLLVERDDERGPGVLRGMLEAINVHAGAKRFTLYPRVGPKRVTCRFPLALQDKAIAGLASLVQVHGTFVYRTDAPFPHAIEVTDLEVFPSVRSVTTLWSLRGIAPGVTGHLTPEEFVRSIRDAG